MKKTLTFLLLFICSFSYAQTVKVNIDAACVTYNDLYNKAFAAVKDNDNNYPNSLLQLNPYSGIVERSMSLSDMPKSIELTPDNKHLYLSYNTLSQIEKIDLESFQIVETVNIGDFRVIDFAILPTNENVLFVVRGYVGYPKNLVMYNNGILQPKQVSSSGIYLTAICVKNDGSMLYVHNGLGSGGGGHLMDVVEDGIEYDGIVWEQMIGSFGEIKNNNDLIYGRSGHIIDAFSDSIPITKAMLPVYKITGGSRGALEYSEIHGCYVLGHLFDYKSYISFFHGQYFNYLGSIELDFEGDNVSDIDIVDEDHFILVSWDSHVEKNSIFFHNISKNLVSSKTKANDSELATKKWHEKYNLMLLEVRNDNFYQPY